ncbi:bacillithiol biosynthesis deacetylase BshB1 [Acidobacteriota bacterium]
MKHVDIACVAPHPDDAELCCGGLLLKAKRAGLSIGVIDCTQGEMATRGSAATRRRESAEADNILKTDVRINLKLKDCHLHDDASLHEPLVSALRKLRSRMVLVPHWEDQHPDHEAVGRAGQKAAWLCGVPKFAPKSGQGVATLDKKPFRPEVILHYQNRYGITPDLIVDISDVMEDKLKLARCYGSQFGPATSAKLKKEPMTKLSSEHFFDWFRAMHGYWGSRIGASYGEPYCVKGALPVFSVGGLFATILT